MGEPEPTRKRTTLAQLVLTIRLSQETSQWMQKNLQGSFAEDTDVFLNEYGWTWAEILKRNALEEVQQYFRSLGIDEDRLPFIEIGDTYRGSFIVAAAVVMAATVGTVYNILKGAAELPKIADGLSDLKKRILKKSSKEIDVAIVDRLKKIAPSGAKPPPYPVWVDLTIDARPLRSLSPATLKTHKIHMGVSISHDQFVLENLGDVPLRDLRIGLFKDSTEMNHWSFHLAYQSSLLLLAERNTIAMDFDRFRSSGGEAFYVSPGNDIYVDCWVQDVSGIYLFRFLLTDT